MRCSRNLLDLWSLILYNSHIRDNHMTSSTQNLLDIATALQAEGKTVKVTVLRPSRRGVKALTGKRGWANAAPKGAFQHGSVPGAASVRSGNKCSKAI